MRLNLKAEIFQAKSWLDLMRTADTDKNGRLGFQEFQEAIMLAQERGRENEDA